MEEFLPSGKLPIAALKQVLGSIKADGLVVQPDVGVDVGVTTTKGKFLVSSSDPITGALERIGWYAVNISANDVATSGIMPDTINTIALFPEGTSIGEIKSVMSDINRTAAGLGIAVAGGHTEITPGLHRPIVAVTAFGSGKSFVTSSNAKAGDSILMTKTAGIEGTSILARIGAIAQLVDTETAEKGKALVYHLSIIPEARAAFSTGLIHAMHDVTEGGLLGAVIEMSLASKLGFELFADRVMLAPATETICTKIRCDPLRLIGSGSLLISCSEAASGRIVDLLSKKGINAKAIGHFLEARRGRWVESGGRRSRVTETSIQDELWPALKKYAL